MIQSDKTTEDQRRKSSDRREAKGRRTSDQDGISDEVIDGVDVPDKRRRKTVRRSGSDRRNPD